MIEIKNISKTFKNNKDRNICLYAGFTGMWTWKQASYAE